MGNTAPDFAETRLMTLQEAVSFRLATDDDRQYVYESTLDNLRETRIASEQILSWGDFVLAWFETSNYIIYIGDQKAGLIRWERTTEALHLTGLYLAKAFRRRGAGKVAIDFFEKYAASQGFKKVSLIVYLSDDVAVNLATGLGYTVERKYQHRAMLVKSLAS
jgi:ribosomal protein S18 acetylase RimI-like enzyme